MPATLKPYRVGCGVKGCPEAARYKIAAEWTDGTLVELKPYGFSCEKHAQASYGEAKCKRAQCRLCPGESLGSVAIYRFQPNVGDRQLERQPDLESAFDQETEKK